MDSYEIVANLKKYRHNNDLFVTECKTGSSVLTSHVRFDAWALKMSFKTPHATGYEVKVSRQDFLRDSKIPVYLGYCHYFYLVCPRELIKPEEVPEGSGLIWCKKSNKGISFSIVKKAPFRDIVIPNELFLYILMWRTTLKDTKHDLQISKELRSQYWVQWIEEKIERKNLARKVSDKIKKQVEDLKRENLGLQMKINDLNAHIERMGDLGGGGQGVDPHKIMALIKDFDIVKRDLINAVDRLKNSI